MYRRPLLPLLALAALLAMLPSCRALSCYSCSDLSANNVQEVNHRVVKADSKPPCSDFDADNSTFKKEPCVFPYNVSCIHLKYGNGKVIRGCYDVLRNNCTLSDQLTECICTTDYCNSAGVTAPALLLLLPAALMAAFYSRQ